MPTALTPITPVWVLIQTGPIDSISIQPYSGNIVYTIAAVLPTDNTLGGHLLDNPAGHTISLETGENIYARSADSYQASMAVTT